MDYKNQIVEHWELLKDYTRKKFMILGLVISYRIQPEGYDTYHSVAVAILQLQMKKEYWPNEFARALFDLIFPDRSKVDPGDLVDGWKFAELVSMLLWSDELHSPVEDRNFVHNDDK